MCPDQNCNIYTRIYNSSITGGVYSNLNVCKAAIVLPIYCTVRWQQVYAQLQTNNIDNGIILHGLWAMPLFIIQELTKRFVCDDVLMVRYIPYD